ncbi:MAG: hypothetical protein AAGD38_24250 [Acidobacteriota bacterium]
MTIATREPVVESPITIARLGLFTPGRRHLVHTRDGGCMRIMRFGPDNTFAHAFFHEHAEQPPVASAVLLPSQVEHLATECVPLSHLDVASLGRFGIGTTRDSKSDVLAAVKEEGAREPAEAEPDEKDPEAIQSPVESDIFNKLKSEELLKETLAKIFGDKGAEIKPGDLIDGTYLDTEKTKPVREIVYFVTREGRPILHSYFNVFYDKDQFPTLIITRTVESIDSRLYRKVVVEQTQKSSSFSAGLTLGLGAQGSFVSSGPAPGDKVHDKGKEATGPSGTTLGFDLGFVKTYNRLRIEAELEVQDTVGKFVTTVTPIPPIGG